VTPDWARRWLADLALMADSNSLPFVLGRVE
jgi:hypothetical protein